MNKVYNILSNKPFKIFYNVFIPKNVRKHWSYIYSNRPKQQEVTDYWQDILKNYFNNEIKKYDMEPVKPNLVGKKIIWQYWGQGLDELPEIVDLCFKSIDKFKNDYKVIRITDETLKDYISLPSFIIDKLESGELRAVFFSDLLRVSLLSVYGGVWLDASIFLTQALPEEYRYYDFFMYSRDPNSAYKSWGKNDIHFYFNWRQDFKVNHLSSVMFSKPNSQISKVLTDLLLYFWETEVDVPHYFFFQILINELKESDYLEFKFPIVDNALPHLLQGCMKQVFIESDFIEIQKKIGVHKLTIHENFKDKIFGKQTYYGYLKNHFLK